jgi:hypothetical protein
VCVWVLICTCALIASISVSRSAGSDDDEACRDNAISPSSRGFHIESSAELRFLKTFSTDVLDVEVGFQMAPKCESASWDAWIGRAVSRI